MFEVYWSKKGVLRYTPLSWWRSSGTTPLPGINVIASLYSIGIDIWHIHIRVLTRACQHSNKYSVLCPSHHLTVPTLKTPNNSLGYDIANDEDGILSWLSYRMYDLKVGQSCRLLNQIINYVFSWPVHHMIHKYPLYRIDSSTMQPSRMNRISPISQQKKLEPKAHPGYLCNATKKHTKKQRKHVRVCTAKQRVLTQKLLGYTYKTQCMKILPCDIQTWGEKVKCLAIFFTWPR